MSEMLAATSIRITAPTGLPGWQTAWADTHPSARRLFVQHALREAAWSGRELLSEEPHERFVDRPATEGGPFFEFIWDLAPARCRGDQHVTPHRGCILR